MASQESVQLGKKKTTKPSVMTDEVVSNLCRNLAIGYTVEVACGMSGISRTAFYDYCAKNPDRAELLQMMRRMPAQQAMINIVDAINAKDIKTSKWYLERMWAEARSRNVTREVE
jgi:hypothetical protein